MKKIALITVIILAVGLVITVVGLALLKFNVISIDTLDTFTTTYSESDAFTDIEVKGSGSEVVLIPSEDGECRVVCTEAENITHTVRVTDGTLYIEKHDNRKWNERIGIFMEDMVIEVYLPESEYSNLKIKNSSGGIKVREGFAFKETDIENTSGSVDFRSCAGSLDINVTSGSIRLQDVSASEISLETTSGSIKAENINAATAFDVHSTSGSIKIERAICGDIDMSASSGSVKLNNSDASEIEIKTSSGSVNGTLLTGKMFETHTSSGSVKVPASEAGSGTCSINTSSGSIKISIGTKE